jgi:hypothetical protein
MEKPELSPNTESYYPPTIVHRISNGDIWWCSLYEQWLSVPDFIIPYKNLEEFHKQKDSEGLSSFDSTELASLWQDSLSKTKHYQTPISSTIHIW